MDALKFVSGALLFSGIVTFVYCMISAMYDLKITGGEIRKSDERWLRLIAPLLAVLVPLNAKFALRMYRASMQLKFRMAGTDAWTVDLFLAAKELLVLLGICLGLMLVRWPSSGGGVMAILTFGILFWFVPNLLLRLRIEERRKHITRELPYILDLLTVSVEAGLDFMQAIERVVLVIKTGELVRELGIMHKCLQVGDSRSTALRQLAFRTEVSDVKTVVSALIQADRLGTGIGAALRTVATQARNQRSQRAEKMAGEATVKLLFPLILVFAAVMLMVLAPVVLQIYKTLK